MVLRRKRHISDRHATSRSPPAAEFEDFLRITPELTESGIKLFFREVGGDEGDVETALELGVNYHHPQLRFVAPDRFTSSSAAGGGA